MLAILDSFGQFGVTLDIRPMTRRSCRPGAAGPGEAATNRRDALRASGVAVAGAVTGGMSGTLHQVLSEPDHMAAALDAGSVSADRLTDLEQTTNELARRMVTSAKFSLLDETVGTFGTVRRLVRERQRTADQVRLVRTGAKLALVASEILFDQHRFSLADRWYRTARRAALDVGDRYLADIALANQTMVPEYSGDPGGVLTLVEPRLEAAPAPSSAVAFLWATKARAHATLGEASAFRHAIGRSRAILSEHPGSTQPDRFGFQTQRLAFYETTGCVRLHDAAGAITAADRTLTLYRSSPFVKESEPLMVRLDQASAYALDGEVEEACRVATAALTDEHAYPAASVLIRAGEFDALLGDNTSAAVRDWRDVLHSTRQT